MYKLHITVEKMYKLYENKQGDYVKYEGNNGCLKGQEDTGVYGVDAIEESGNSCLGWNYAQKEDNTTRTGFGSCANPTYPFTTYGWRIAYIEGQNAYLISAGSPECDIPTYEGDNNQDYIDLANAQAKKYCNRNYVDNCNSDEDVHVINNIDFNKITKQISPEYGGGYLFEAIEGAIKCIGNGYIYDPRCGINNDLIYNNGYYAFAARVNDVNNNNAGVVYDSSNKRIDPAYWNSALGNYALGLRPVIKISSSVYVTGGKGTMDEPYIIANN